VEEKEKQMKYKIYADCHLGSPIEIKPDGLFDPSGNTILLGDIVDLANCENKMVEYYNNLRHQFIRIHKDNYIDGNHERIYSFTNNFVIKNNIIFAHGDLEANFEKWVKYRQKSHGAGWFKRKFIIPFIREAEEIINRKPKEEFLLGAWNLAKLSKCTTYVCGHFHPKEKIDIFYRGVRIIIVPRGMTELEL